MKIVLALAAVLLVAACAGDGDTTATDPGSSADAMPTAIPAAPGGVRTLNLVTVMDTGSPELCLGPVAESYPPQCSGPTIDGWSWADHQGTFDSQQGIRWGEYSVSGSWDGTTFTYAGAVPAALYDAMVAPETERPTPETEYTEEELADIAEDLGELPGAQSSYTDRGNALVDVVYDDGSLQEWADDTFGAGVVVVTSMLVDEG